MTRHMHIAHTSLHGNTHAGLGAPAGIASDVRSLNHAQDAPGSAQGDASGQAAPSGQLTTQDAPGANVVRPAGILASGATAPSALPPRTRRGIHVVSHAEWMALRRTKRAVVRRKVIRRKTQWHTRKPHKRLHVRAMNQKTRGGIGDSLPRYHKVLVISPEQCCYIASYIGAAIRHMVQHSIYVREIMYER